MNKEYLLQKLEMDQGVMVKSLDDNLMFSETQSNVTSSYSKFKEVLLVVQNPTQQVREQLVEIQLPYYNYTIYELKNGTKEEFTQFEKFLPRVWQNGNTTFVKSICSFPVKFEEAGQLAKVFVIANEGVIRKKIKPPANYKGRVEIWNLNVPIFLPRFEGDIQNF
mmetsp:Transcript_21879/g.33931  ORF Transcript_21879/g.33931 Transcript_21879/m.33931 type:complete len:165 (+) Transcript_21879:2053-2547(+)